MTLLHKQHVETKTHREWVGFTCDGCEKRHVFDEAHPQGVNGMVPHTWERFLGADFCAECVVKIQAELRRLCGEKPGTCARCSGPIDEAHREQGWCPVNPP